MAKPVGDRLRLGPGAVALNGIDTRATPGFDGDKDAAAAAQAKLAERLAVCQEQLYAEARMGGSRRLLLVLQGLDTSGKGGTVKHVLGPMDPAGVKVAGFGKPTAEELHHDFLWRIRRALPPAGKVGVLDRSHYEDVVTARVLGLADEATIELRYGAINRFEAELAEAGTEVVKCFLHISAEEQQERLLARLDDPTKHWKYNPADLDTRARWDDYTAAYAAAFERCSTEAAPWYVVPADRKWYRNWAITSLLVERLEALGLRWPEARFDVAAERLRVERS
jgi:PPK2 family polyphosphate:nucleotide phosphotransferase